MIDDQELAGALGPFESQPEFSQHGSIDGAVSSSERLAPSGAYSAWKSNCSVIPVLSITMRPDSPRAWVNCAMVPPGHVDLGHTKVSRLAAMRPAIAPWECNSLRSTVGV